MNIYLRGGGKFSGYLEIDFHTEYRMYSTWHLNYSRMHPTDDSWDPQDRAEVLLLSTTERKVWRETGMDIHEIQVKKEAIATKGDDGWWTVGPIHKFYKFDEEGIEDYSIHRSDSDYGSDWRREKYIRRLSESAAKTVLKRFNYTDNDIKRVLDEGVLDCNNCPIGSFPGAHKCVDCPEWPNI